MREGIDILITILESLRWLLPVVSPRLGKLASQQMTRPKKDRNKSKGKASKRDSRKDSEKASRQVQMHADPDSTLASFLTSIPIKKQK